MTAGVIEIDLSAAIVALRADTPLIVTTKLGPVDGGEAALPFGAFEPTHHRTLEIALRTWVEEQTALPLGYTEQLYTFADRGRHAEIGDSAPHTVSIGYLALARASNVGDGANRVSWSDWYGYFPWEDWRYGRPEILDETLLASLDAWAASTSGPARDLRIDAAFGAVRSDLDATWDEERTLERYELLYEAGLVQEAWRDGRDAARSRGEPSLLGRSMRFDHRRILATAISRLRGKLKYRPVIFELMPRTFTLTELQTAAEAISGRRLHKQNFRRLVESARLVEPTGAKSSPSQGRPASLYRFRQDVLRERPGLGLRLGSR